MPAPHGEDFRHGIVKTCKGEQNFTRHISAVVVRYLPAVSHRVDAMAHQSVPNTALKPNHTIP
jgi:hypothetical protein